MARAARRDAPWLFRWRDALLSEAGPPFARRHVLNVLAGYGDEHGNRIFPSTETLAVATGMSRRRVEEHLREAEAAGWIERTPVGDGRGWRRMTYSLRIPGRADGASQPQADEVRTERPDHGHRGADDGGTEVRTERPINSPVTLQSSPKGTADAVAPEGEAGSSDDTTPTSDSETWNAGGLVAAWIERRGQRPPDAAVRRQGAFAKRLVADYTRRDLERALAGMNQLFPYSKGDPWDLGDLERKIAKALVAPLAPNGSANAAGAERQSYPVGDGSAARYVR